MCRTSQSLELLDFLRDWLVRHILSADKELAPHLIARGIL